MSFHMTTSWQPTTLVQCVSVKPWLTYPGCDEPGGCHDLTLGRIYELLGVEANGSFYRILDDSGDEFLYPTLDAAGDFSLSPAPHSRAFGASFSGSPPAPRRSEVHDLHAHAVTVE